MFSCGSGNGYEHDAKLSFETHKDWGIYHTVAQHTLSVFHPLDGSEPSFRLRPEQLAKLISEDQYIFDENEPRFTTKNATWDQRDMNRFRDEDDRFIAEIEKAIGHKLPSDYEDNHSIPNK